MKNILITSMLALSSIFVLLMSFASAQCGDITLVNGTVYQAGGSPTSDPIEGASVTVYCEHYGLNYTMQTTSLSEGYYAVIFPNMYPNDQCGLGDSIYVLASHPNYKENGVSGAIATSVEISLDCTVNSDEINVPLIPEYGLLVAGLTIMGALITFFIIRKHN